MLRVLECIDAGSEYCPCYLSVVGECIMCSQLRGKTFCDCRNWKGVCIYQEFVNNRNQMKVHRESFTCRLVDKERVGEDVIILKIKTNKTMARELNNPGAYVFLRSNEEPSYFDTPMSVMLADEQEGVVTTAIQIRGVKTKLLNIKANERIKLRGPYWNGLLGLKYLKVLKNSSALIVTRGVGQAPALPVARKLIMAGNRVEVILDKGRSGENFAEPYFKELGCETVNKQMLDIKNLKVKEEILEYIKESVEEKGVRLLYSGGSEILHRGIGRSLLALRENVYFVCSNDARFCCGEGVCGSCHTRLDGSRIKTCKTQVNPIELY